MRRPSFDSAAPRAEISSGWSIFATSALAQLQRLDKPLPQCGNKGQRPAAEQHLRFWRAPAREGRQRLVDNRIEDRREDIRVGDIAAEQILHIGFGKHPAARGNWINRGGCSAPLPEAFRPAG